MTTQNFKVMTNCKKLFKIQPTREKKKKKKKPETWFEIKPYRVIETPIEPPIRIVF